jgi:uncharacterized protein involved in exopolysaccharide biosynthesis
MTDEQNDFLRVDRFEGPPKGYFVVVPGNSGAQIFDLAKFGHTLLGSWKILLGAAVVAAVTAAVISLQMRNVYRSVTLIAPVIQEPGGGNSLGNRLGGLAALAGIDVGDAGARKVQSFATLTSATLARKFIADQNMLPILYEDRWDAKANHWLRNPPAMDAAVKRLATSVVVVTENRTTSIVTVAAEWYSPELAARWANRMVELVNDQLRAEATISANRSIEYLNKELTKTSVEEIRQGIYRLIEEQENKAMLATVEREYAYHVIDPAVPPDLKFAPKRAVITLLAGMGGFFLAVVFVFVRSSFSRKSFQSAHSSMEST